MEDPPRHRDRDRDRHQCRRRDRRRRGRAELPSYTLIGDAVNVAARLVQRARAGEALFSLSVKQALDPVPQGVLELPPLVLRGRTRPVEIYCLESPTRLDVSTAAPPLAPPPLYSSLRRPAICPGSRPGQPGGTVGHRGRLSVATPQLSGIFGEWHWHQQPPPGRYPEYVSLGPCGPPGCEGAFRTTPPCGPIRPARRRPQHPVALTWGAVTDATRYAILWDNNPGAATYENEIKDIEATSFVHTGLARPYHYQIVAETSGGRGPESRAVCDARAR